MKSARQKPFISLCKSFVTINNIHGHLRRVNTVNSSYTCTTYKKSNTVGGRRTRTHTRTSVRVRGWEGRTRTKVRGKIASCTTVWMYDRVENTCMEADRQGVYNRSYVKTCFEKSYILTLKREIYLSNRMKISFKICCNTLKHFFTLVSTLSIHSDFYDSCNRFSLGKVES